MIVATRHVIQSETINSDSGSLLTWQEIFGSGHSPVAFAGFVRITDAVTATEITVGLRTWTYADPALSATVKKYIDDSSLAVTEAISGAAWQGDALRWPGAAATPQFPAGDGLYVTWTVTGGSWGSAKLNLTLNALVVPNR